MEAQIFVAFSSDCTIVNICKDSQEIVNGVMNDNTLFKLL